MRPLSNDPNESERARQRRSQAVNTAVHKKFATIWSCILASKTRSCVSPLLHGRHLMGYHEGVHAYTSRI